VASLTALPLFGFSLWPPGLGWLLPVAALVVWSWLAVVLSKMTFAEVSRLRPATWSDGASGSLGATFHLCIAQGFLLLLLGGLVIGLRILPGWLSTHGNEETARFYALGAQMATVAGMVAVGLSWAPF